MTTKLIPRTPEQCALIDERVRQEKAGELDAGYWRWYSSTSGIPYVWTFYNPSLLHPHYGTFIEWQRLVDAGEVAKGWYNLEERCTENSSAFGVVNDEKKWCVDGFYTIVKTDKHPDNCKLVLKLIDWSKLIGCATSQGELVKFNAPWAWTLSKECCSLLLVAASNLRIAKQTKWTYWEHGDETYHVPPEGVIVEVALRNGLKDKGASIEFHWTKDSTIIAYRIISLADGWTDDQEKAAK